MAKMVNVTIDGLPVSVAEGTTIIEAAKQAQVTIPHYCYHPGLSIAGNCRICLVEIEKVGKLQIACYTTVAEGMVIHTKNPRVKAGQENVLEFLLANHPLDCPVCDQSGECKLQNYYMSYGQYDSRFNEQKVKKVKAIPVGPHVMLDAERCILCSRCVRFTDEVTQTHEFGIFNRGDHAEIGLYPGKTLDNAYSGNTVDICPVGALTDIDFRFKCRVWYLQSQESVCPGCSQGCNIDVHFQLARKHIADGDRVMRLKPRQNLDVNGYWICDEGRYAYPAIDHHRLETPLVNGQPAEWARAVEVVAQALREAQSHQAARGVAVLASPHATNEELFVVKRLFREHIGTPHVDVRLPYPQGSADELLRKAEKSPNMKGALTLGLVSDRTGLSGTQIVEEAGKGMIRVLYVMHHDLFEMFSADQVNALLQNVPCVVFHGTHRHRFAQAAHVVLSSAVYAEKDGTFTNVQGRVQRIRTAFPPLGSAKVDLEIFRLLADQLAWPWPWSHPAAVLAEIGLKYPPFRGMTYDTIGSRGQVLAKSGELVGQAS